ncbi:MAG: glycosyltransferase, partial [bacterium]|nr:glycosyltransferase [bacterium]
MRIAMIGQKGMPAHFGGIETHVSELATRLVQSGHHVTVYARPWYQKDSMRVYNGVRIVTLPSIRTKRLDTISHTLLSILHATFVLRADIIHIHGVGPAILAWLPKLLRPVSSVVTTFHCIDADQKKWGRFARFMLRIG